MFAYRSEGKVFPDTLYVPPPGYKPIHNYLTFRHAFCINKKVGCAVGSRVMPALNRCVPWEPTWPSEPLMDGRYLADLPGFVFISEISEAQQSGFAACHFCLRKATSLFSKERNLGASERKRLVSWAVFFFSAWWSNGCLHNLFSL